MNNMILLTTVGGSEVFVDKRRIFAIHDKNSHSVVFVGNERFAVSETPDMIFDLAEAS